MPVSWEAPGHTAACSDGAVRDAVTVLVSSQPTARVLGVGGTPVVCFGIKLECGINFVIEGFCVDLGIVNKELDW